MSKHLQGSTILLYGPVKIGKTQTCATFPKPLFVASEKGHRYIDPSIPVISLVSVPNYKENRRKLLTLIKKHKPETIIIDTISAMYQVIFRYVCKEENVVHPAKKGDYGRAIWQMIREEMATFIETVIQAGEDCGSTVIFVCHSKCIQRETASKSYEQVTYDLAFQLGYLLPQSVDHVWLIGHRFDAEDTNETRDRVLYLKGDIYIDVDTRDENISTKKILLTKNDKPVNAYRRISKVFDRDHNSNGK